MSKQDYLLHVTISPQGDNSVSRKLASALLEKFHTNHPKISVKTRDLNENQLDHLDGETIAAGYIPVDKRTSSQASKHQLRLDLIEEITSAQAIVISTPMWNWNVPSVLKAYIDQLIIPGVFDGTSKRLAGKPVTVLIACGGSYHPGSHNEKSDFLTGYLKQVFTILGATDVKIIRSEYTLAGVVPGMESLIEKKENSLKEALKESEARGVAMFSSLMVAGANEQDATNIDSTVENTTKTAPTTAPAAQPGCCIIA